MVGVAGRSKGCHTCRQRKIACSLEKPFCTTCSRSGRACKGYHKERVFILDHRSKLDKKENSHHVSSSKPDSRSAVERKTETPVYTGQLAIMEGTIPTGTAYDSLQNITSPSTRAAYRQQILNEFLFIHLPTAAIGFSNPRHEVSSTWFTMLPTLNNYTAALEVAILAVCTARLGRANNDSNLVRESLKFYIKGLWELQKALWNPNLMHLDETLAACMALMLYEVMECPAADATGLISHLKGCSKLFYLKGPKAYNSEFGHQLFVSFRQMEIQQALGERRVTFLAEPEWLQLPWEGFQKPIRSLLLDLTASITTIVELGYRLVADPEKKISPSAAYSALTKLISECWKVDIRLHSFYQRLEKDSGSPVYWPELSSGKLPIPDQEGNVFPVAFHFIDLKTAHTCMLYWATQSILWSGMGFLYRIQPFVADIKCSDSAPEKISILEVLVSNANLPTPPTSLHPLEHRTDIAALAKNICQSLEYCVHGDCGAIGLVAAVFPLKVAIEALNDAKTCEMELQWAQKAMEMIGVGGIKILNHLGVPLTTHSFIPG